MNSAPYWAILTLISVANCWRMQLLLACVAEYESDGSRSTTMTVPLKSGWRRGTRLSLTRSLHLLRWRHRRTGS